MDLNRYQIGVASVITRENYYIRCKECQATIAKDLPLAGTFIPLIDTVGPIEHHEELYHSQPPLA